MAKILVITAGWEQISLIKRAKELGHEVIATHSDEKGEALKFADKTYIVDPRDALKIYDIAVSEKIDGVISDQCDYSYFTTAFISEKIGLPGPKLQTALVVTNKERSRRKLSQNPNICQPLFEKCESYEESIKACEKIGFPIVIKPSDNRGSIGVKKVEKQDEVKDAFLLALINSHSKTVLVEEFIEGTEIAIDSYYLKGKGNQILSISSKKHWEQGLFDKEIITPPEISDESLEKAKKMNQEVVKVLGMDFGPSHIEYMVTSNNKVYLMEAHNRGGGVFISNKVNPLVSGINVQKCLILDCLNKEYNDINLNHIKSHTLIKFVSLPPGKLMSVGLKNEDQIKDCLVALKIYAALGKELPKIGDCTTRHGFIIVSGNTKQELFDNFDRVYDNLVLDYE